MVRNYKITLLNLALAFDGIILSIGLRILWLCCCYQNLWHWPCHCGLGFSIVTLSLEIIAKNEHIQGMSKVPGQL